VPDHADSAYKSNSVLEILHSRRDPTGSTEGDVLVLRVGEPESRWESRQSIAVEVPDLMAKFPYKLLRRNRIDCPQRDFERHKEEREREEREDRSPKRAREKELPLSEATTTARLKLGHVPMNTITAVIAQHPRPARPAKTAQPGETEIGNDGQLWEAVTRRRSRKDKPDVEFMQWKPSSRKQSGVPVAKVNTPKDGQTEEEHGDEEADQIRYAYCNILQ
jgi:hypothetical protein